MIISEIQSEIRHCSCDGAKFKGPPDFSHRAILFFYIVLKYTGKLQITHKLHNVIYSRRCRRNNVLVQNSNVYYQVCTKDRLHLFIVRTIILQSMNIKE